MDNHKIITIGRQFGSGGKSIANHLSELLGIPVYDRELLSKAGQEIGYGPEFFADKDEKKSFLSLGIFGSNRYGKTTDNLLSDEELFKVQSDVIRKIASGGDAIFIGRASDYVLRDMHTLDVFISAPMEERIRNVAGRLSISEDEAEKLIRRKDRSRAGYYNFYTFGDNWGVASNYDLCIDSSILGFRGTAEFIIDFGRKCGYLGE